jgi:hypothetical protein
MAVGDSAFRLEREITTRMRGGHSMEHPDRFHKMKILAWISPFIIAAGVLCAFSIADKSLERKAMSAALGETTSVLLGRLGKADDVSVDGDFSTYQYDSHISLKRYVFIFKDGILVDRKVLYSY